MNQKREFPNWEKLYQTDAVESMPWFNPELDPDLDRALTQLHLKTGSALDLGTGPGTQAIALAERGFDVTATDLSETAVNLAKEKAQQKGFNVSFQTDDILNTHLNRKFDLVFDRGCFHVLPPECRLDYVRTVAGLIKSGGYLFLKCFSYLETRESGPYRFTPTEIQEMFGDRFHVRSIEETVYHGTLNPLPKALFCQMEKS
ncbi:MAG: methyltransferase domain-containing protein [Cyanosarcina radialis HA8281-LM2]|jgi:cyclopropane fatty-acyl-phospholipid synthase-like methyltransferase|nr:methyltransferase domain-containing protein [Cyanosarcina radialis HA8281-LM2]